MELLSTLDRDLFLLIILVFTRLHGNYYRISQPNSYLENRVPGSTGLTSEVSALRSMGVSALEEMVQDWQGHWDFTLRC